MAVNNFIPTIWSANLLKERDRISIAVANCNKNWECEIKSVGDKVKINAISDVTLSDYTKNSTTISYPSLDDNSAMLEITEAKYFAFSVEDVDKLQTKGDFKAEAIRRSATVLSNTADQFVYGLYAEAGATVTQGSLTSGNVTSTISSALTALLANDVPEGMERYLEVTPAVYEKMVLAGIIKSYENDARLVSGSVGQYLGFKVFVSNNISGASGTGVHYCYARTKDAITFAEQINKMEAVRLETKFADGVRGLHLYGAKVIRPKELVTLALTTTTETAI